MNKLLHDITHADGLTAIAFRNRFGKDRPCLRSREVFFSALPRLTIYPPQRHRGHRGFTENLFEWKCMNTNVNQLSREIIGSAIEVHRKLGPGLLESCYRQCLCRELLLRGVPYQRERKLPLEYRGLKLECGYRIDILVSGVVVVEVKSVEALAPIHDAQLLTYLRLGGWRVGLSINFNVVVLKDGIHRKILGYDWSLCALCVLCVSVVDSTLNRSRRAQMPRSEA